MQELHRTTISHRIQMCFSNVYSDNCLRCFGAHRILDVLLDCRICGVLLDFTHVLGPPQFSVEYSNHVEACYVWNYIHTGKPMHKLHILDAWAVWIVETFVAFSTCVGVSLPIVTWSSWLWYCMVLQYFGSETVWDMASASPGLLWLTDCGVNSRSRPCCRP